MSESAMRDTSTSDNAAPGIRAAKPSCPLYRVGQSAPAQLAFLVSPIHHFAVAVVTGDHDIAQAEAGYRISFNRARQKRGPPALS